MNNSLKRIGLFTLLGLAIFWAVLNKESINPANLESSIKNAGLLAPLFFMLLYIISTVLFLPGAVLTLLGGALFGPVLGTFYSLTAATIGAMLAFLITRYLAADWVSNKTAGRTRQLINGVETEGWRFVAFTRLVPLFPFNLLNYALGLTKISFLQYSLATYIFMLPGAFAYTYLGYIGKEAATGGEDLIQKVMLALALLAIVAFIPRLLSKWLNKNRISCEQLKSQLDEKKPMLLLDVRSEADFSGEQGHISQALSIPLEDLQQRLDEIADFKNKLVVTICRTDKRSAQAALLLTNRGFENVQVASMGMTDWIKHHYPVTR